MENKYNDEDEGVITFLAWRFSHNLNEISKELKDTLYPTISQLPKSSKRMCYRMRSILIHNSNTLDEFWNKS